MTNKMNAAFFKPKRRRPKRDKGRERHKHKSGTVLIFTSCTELKKQSIFTYRWVEQNWSNHTHWTLKKMKQNRRIAWTSQKVGRWAIEGLRTGFIEKLTDLFSRKETISVILDSLWIDTIDWHHLMWRFSTHVEISQTFYRTVLPQRPLIRVA